MRWGFDDNGIGAEAEYIIDKKVLYIYFRGSNSFKDWIDNFYIWNTKTEFGFHRKWYYYAFRAFRFFKNLDWEEAVIAGFSHGGAIGKIFTYLINKKTNRFVREVYTYNAPKASKYMYKNHCNYVRKGDIVHLLPFGWAKPLAIYLQRITLNPFKAHNLIPKKRPWEFYNVQNRV